MVEFGVESLGIFDTFIWYGWGCWRCRGIQLWVEASWICLLWRWLRERDIREAGQPLEQLATCDTVHGEQLGELPDHAGLEIRGTICLSIHNALYCLADMTNHTCLCPSKGEISGFNFLDRDVPKLRQFQVNQSFGSLGQQWRPCCHKCPIVAGKHVIPVAQTICVIIGLKHFKF